MCPEVPGTVGSLCFRGWCGRRRRPGVERRSHEGSGSQCHRLLPVSECASATRWLGTRLPAACPEGCRPNPVKSIADRVVLTPRRSAFRRLVGLVVLPWRRCRVAGGRMHKAGAAAQEGVPTGRHIRCWRCRLTRSAKPGQSARRSWLGKSASPRLPSQYVVIACVAAETCCG